MDGLSFLLSKVQLPMCVTSKQIRNLDRHQRTKFLVTMLYIYDKYLLPCKRLRGFRLSTFDQNGRFVLFTY